METYVEGIETYTINQNVTDALIHMAVVKAKKSPLIEYLQENIKKEVDIGEVRYRLSKIKGSFAKDIIENRSDRL